MQVTEQQLIILQSILKALILIKGLKDESMKVWPLLLYCLTLSCLSISLSLAYTNTITMFPKP